MPSTGKPNCTEDEFHIAIARAILEIMIRVGQKVQGNLINPIGYVLGGQPGADKSNLIKLLQKRRNDNIVSISGDDFSPYHPHFVEYQRLYGKDSPKYTAKFSSLMTEAIIKHFIDKRYNLVIEGTFRTSQTPINTLRMLRDDGYETGCFVQFCNKTLSWKSCQERYEKMKEQEPIMARAVDKVHHDYVVEHIADNIRAVYDSKLTDSFEIYERHNNGIDLIFDSHKSQVLDTKRLDKILGHTIERSKDYGQER